MNTSITQPSNFNFCFYCFAVSHPNPEAYGNSAGNQQQQAIPNQYRSNQYNNMLGLVRESNFRLWESGPNFDTKLPQNVTAIHGKTAQLTCKVYDLGNKTVSWIRHENLHIISAGRYTYTSDTRFQAVHPDDSDEWVLKIRDAKVEDSGMYECQVSTQPVRSYFVHLRVGVPVATILGEAEIYLDAGSTINITCVVKHTPVPPSNVHWEHQGKAIDYTSTRGGVSVLTNKAETTVSSLIIQKAGVDDGGVYSCQAGQIEPTSVKVHVLTGDNLRGLHTNSACHLQSSLPSLVAIFIFMELVQK